MAGVTDTPHGLYLSGQQSLQVRSGTEWLACCLPQSGPSIQLHKHPLYKLLHSQKPNSNHEIAKVFPHCKQNPRVWVKITIILTILAAGKEVVSLSTQVPCLLHEDWCQTHCVQKCIGSLKIHVWHMTYKHIHITQTKNLYISMENKLYNSLCPGREYGFSNHWFQPLIIYVCICRFEYTWIYMCKYTCVWIYVCVNMFVWIYVCVHAYVCIHVHKYKYTISQWGQHQQNELHKTFW